MQYGDGVNVSVADADTVIVGTKVGVSERVNVVLGIWLNVGVEEVDRVFDSVAKSDEDWVDVYESLRPNV